MSTGSLLRARCEHTRTVETVDLPSSQPKPPHVSASSQPETASRSGEGALGGEVGALAAQLAVGELDLARHVRGSFLCAGARGLGFAGRPGGPAGRGADGAGRRRQPFGREGARARHGPGASAAPTGDSDSRGIWTSVGTGVIPVCRTAGDGRASKRPTRAQPRRMGEPAVSITRVPAAGLGAWATQLVDVGEHGPSGLRLRACGRTDAQLVDRRDDVVLAGRGPFRPARGEPDAPEAARAAPRRCERGGSSTRHMRMAEDAWCAGDVAVGTVPVQLQALGSMLGGGEPRSLDWPS